MCGALLWVSQPRVRVLLKVQMEMRENLAGVWSEISVMQMSNLGGEEGGERERGLVDDDQRVGFR